MTVSAPITHAKVSGLPSDGDNTKIQGPDWDGEHRIDPAGVSAILSLVTQTAQGMVPPPLSAGAGTYLGWNGSAFGWTTPPGTGGGTADGVFTTLNLSPLLVPPDLGPGSLDSYNPWTAAGSTTGSHACVVINTSSLGATIAGLVSTGRRGDILVIEVGGDGHGFLTIAHMASATPAHRIYCPDGADVQCPKGGTVVLQCLNDTDHGWRFIAAFTGNRNNTGKAADFVIGASTNNWNPWATGPARGRRWRVTVPTAGATLTGIAGSPDGVLFYNDGEIITLQNMGDGLNNASATLSLKNFSASSSNGNKIITPGFVGVDNPTIVVPLYGVIQVMRDNQFDSNTGAWFVLGKW